MDVLEKTGTDYKPPPGGLIDIQSELDGFEKAERARLGLDTQRKQWEDPNPNTFTAAQRSHTTMLVAGLTQAHDLFIRAGLAGAGYNVQVLDCPDNEALRFGKEFGNRGQCNPTYFTVGNLVKFLTHLRDEKGMAAEEIINSYLFVTAGACGPCRFGMYVTEYRKALRDAGFHGFRVILVTQSGGVDSVTGDGFSVRKRDVGRVFKGIIIGDVLNALMYRIRPYELEKGATDRAMAECREIISNSLAQRRSLLTAAWKCRKILSKIRVDRTQVKPRAAIIGEFWAMTTEGDGNYQLQRFLEEEGAEVDVQLVSAWLLFLIWEARWDTGQRLELKGEDPAKKGLKGVGVRTRIAKLWLADTVVRAVFYTYAWVMGLKDYHLPDQQEVADISHRYYDNSVRGGEGHMEVGKLIQNVVGNKVNITISVKPFGCMPSSGVSDGIQSAVVEHYPEAIFLPIETSGDGAVNIYSRVQMQLFKARQAAHREVEDALSRSGRTLDEIRDYVSRAHKYGKALYRHPHKAGCTAADLVHEVAAGGGCAPPHNGGADPK